MVYVPLIFRRCLDMSISHRSVQAEQVQQCVHRNMKKRSTPRAHKFKLGTATVDSSLRGLHYPSHPRRVANMNKDINSGLHPAPVMRMCTETQARPAERLQACTRLCQVLRSPFGYTQQVLAFSVMKVPVRPKDSLLRRLKNSDWWKTCRILCKNLRTSARFLCSPATTLRFTTFSPVLLSAIEVQLLRSYNPSLFNQLSPLEIWKL